MKITPNVVADFFLEFCNTHGDCLTNLKLQKLVYYAQAWYLALYNKPLFDEEIQAWTHGPVIPSLYKRFKPYGWNPIIEKVKTRLSKEIKKHLTEIFSVYGRYSAWDLERMTHQETPWILARKGISNDEACENIITKKSMRDFYKKLSQSNG